MTDSLIFSGASVLQCSSTAVQVVGTQGLFFPLKDIGILKCTAVNKNWEPELFEGYEGLQHLSGVIL